MAGQTAKDVMTTDVYTVRTDSSLEETARLLAERRISGAPVVDDTGRVLGVVSEADLIDLHAREAKIPRVALFGFIPLPDDVVREAAHRSKLLTAGDLMSKKVLSVKEDTSLHEIADLMVRNKINRVPVLRDGRLVGLVCRSDLVRGIAQGKEL